MINKQLISRDIELFYNKASEETRLDKGMGVFEFERVKALIEKYILSAPATIVDVGGGTGKYAEWLAKKGHEVHLIEPIYKHVTVAKDRSNRLKNKFHIHQGASHQLGLPSNFANLVILHGPLYHLQKREDRALAISEARRVLKTGGIVLGFAINYTASTLVGLLNRLIHKKTFFDMCKKELTTGIHNPPFEFPWLLAEAYYHNPKEFKDEFESEGLKYLNTYAVEGMAWLDKEYFVNMLDENRKATLSELVQITENDGYLLSFSPHMMIAVQKELNYGK